MFAKALLFFVVIIFSGLGFLLCFIFFIIRLSTNHPKRWNWLAPTLVCLVVLIFSIALFVKKAVKKVTHAGEEFAQTIERSAAGLDSASNDFHYKLMDSSNYNPMIRELKKLEQNIENKVPDEFYVYLGFRDYYRMPITYPYSLHCNDILESASLFNEINVSEFNVSNNGETDCNVNDITEFAFDKNVLIAKQKTTDDKKEKFVIYQFSNNRTLEFDSQKSAFASAKKELHYEGPDTLVKVITYYNLFK